MKPKSRKEKLLWTRKLEMKLVEFIKERECIWKPIDNTNHNIQLKYKAYAEFAALLGGDFTARSVRDRWVNIRSTFNHNQRKIEQSRKTAKSNVQVYVPSWPLWKNCQFLSGVRKGSNGNVDLKLDIQADDLNLASLLDASACDQLNDSKTDLLNVDYASASNINDDDELLIPIRQRGTIRKRAKVKKKNKHSSSTKNKLSSCKKVLDDLVHSLRPICSDSNPETAEVRKSSNFWYLGRHVTETLTKMRKIDAECAAKKIKEIIEKYSNS